MLSQDRLKSKLSYDRLTGEFRWLTGRLAGTTAGYFNVRYWRIKIDGRLYYAHTLAWLYVYGEWRLYLDHKDRNKVNNAIGNLRPATNEQNQQNVACGGSQKSGNYFKARIMVNGERITIGHYKTREEAGKAYHEAKREFHPFGPV